MNYYKIAACVGGILFILFTIGSCSTPDFKWCRSDWNTLGYSCEAWIQSLSQVFGGVATLGAVVWAFNFNRIRDREQMVETLKVVAYEIRSAERAFGFFSNHTKAVDQALAALPPAGQARQAATHLRTMSAKRMPIYESSGAALARLSVNSADRVIEAISHIDSWGSYVSAAASSSAPQAVLGEVGKRAGHIAKSCKDALTTLEAELGIEIS